MVTIGDVKNNLKILQSEAKQMKYNEDFDLEGLAKGNPQSLLPLYHHLFTGYNCIFTEEVMNVVGDVLSTKSDVRFMESVYKILRDMLNFKPSMTKEQFFTLNNFAERKIIMCIEIMRAVRERCRFMGPKNPTNPHIKVNPVVDTGLHPKKDDGKGESPSACDQVGRVSSQQTLKPALEVVSDPQQAEPHPPRKFADKVCRPAHSLMGMSEKENWHVKLGYLRPKSPEEHPEGVKKEEDGRKRSLSISRDKEKEFMPATPVDSKEKNNYSQMLTSPPGPQLKKSRSKLVEVVQVAHGKRPGEQMKMMMHDQDQDEWDPSEAVECILSKVRDLPTQLTSFMKAVESRLLKIEDRLDYVEAVVSGINHSEGKTLYTDVKREVDLLQARITLLENRVTLAESKANNPMLSETLKQFHSDDKRSDYSTGGYAALERGDSDNPSWRQVQYFSPIHPSVVEVVAASNDTITSLADADDRRSSTPNHSAFALYTSTGTADRRAAAGPDRAANTAVHSGNLAAQSGNTAVESGKWAVQRGNTAAGTGSRTGHAAVQSGNLAAQSGNAAVQSGNAAVPQSGSTAAGTGHTAVVEAASTFGSLPTYFHKDRAAEDERSAETMTFPHRPVVNDRVPISTRPLDEGRVINVLLDNDNLTSQMADITLDTVLCRDTERMAYDSRIYSDNFEDEVEEYHRSSKRTPFETSEASDYATGTFADVRNSGRTNDEFSPATKPSRDRTSVEYTSATKQSIDGRDRASGEYIPATKLNTEGRDRTSGEYITATKPSRDRTSGEYMPATKQSTDSRDTSTASTNSRVSTQSKASTASGDSKRSTLSANSKTSSATLSSKDRRSVHDIRSAVSNKPDRPASHGKTSSTTKTHRPASGQQANNRTGSTVASSKAASSKAADVKSTSQAPTASRPNSRKTATKSAPAGKGATNKTEKDSGNLSETHSTQTQSGMDHSANNSKGEQSGQLDMSSTLGHLDMSTMQQVERIKQMFQATKQFFPDVEKPADG